MKQGKIERRCVVIKVNSAAEHQNLKESRTYDEWDRCEEAPVILSSRYRFNSEEIKKTVARLCSRKAPGVCTSRE